MATKATTRVYIQPVNPVVFVAPMSGVNPVVGPVHPLSNFSGNGQFRQRVRDGRVIRQVAPGVNIRDRRAR